LRLQLPLRGCENMGLAPTQSRFPLATCEPAGLSFKFHFCGGWSRIAKNSSFRRKNEI
jgi:hypothetical protein